MNGTIEFSLLYAHMIRKWIDAITSSTYYKVDLIFVDNRIHEISGSAYQTLWTIYRKMHL